MIKLSHDEIISRENIVFRLARLVNGFGYRFLTIPHVDLHDGFRELANQQKNNTPNNHPDGRRPVFLYTSLHKSLWETTGLLVALDLQHIVLPFTGMGDNLVKGKFFQSMAKKMGVFLIKRPQSRREMLQSARMLKEYIINYLAHGENVLVFPEGTRKSIVNEGQYGGFFPAAFEAVLEYEKNKPQFIAEYPDLTPYDTYIVPVNVDYSKIREDREMLWEVKKPLTLHVFDSLKMFKNVGHTYLSFGKPLRVSDYMDMNRKDLAAHVRDKCLDLVKILPVNVVSHAILNSVEGDTDSENRRINFHRIETNLAAVVRKLSPMKDRFRGFSVDDAPADIIERVARSYGIFKPKYITVQNLALYRLYAGYISNYTDQSQQ